MEEVKVSPGQLAQFHEWYLRALAQGYTPDMATRRTALVLGIPGWNIGEYRVTVDYTLPD